MPDTIILLAVGSLLIMTVRTLFLMISFFKIAPPGVALVRYGQGGTFVSFTKMMVFPVMHKLEYLDIRLKQFTIARENKEGVICKDNLRINIRVEVFMRVNHREEEVVGVVQNVGAERAGQVETLRQLFEASFLDAIKTVTKQFTYEDILHYRDEYRSKILEHMGLDFNGFMVDNVHIPHISLTPQQYLDPDNLLDAKAIKTMTKELAKVQRVNNSQQNELRQDWGRRSLDVQEVILQLQNTRDEEVALHQAKIRYLKDKNELEIRSTQLLVKLKNETSEDIRKRLDKQIFELEKKKTDLTTQLEMEEKSIKVRYHRRYLETRQSQDLPPEE